MATWNESDYVQQAGEIAKLHVTSKRPLNELATKVARDNSLNPDEIRTLVRLSNVATFQELFKNKMDGDKMVEFDTGDPESVINSLVQEAQTPPETANIHNDKLASEIPDLMREKRQGFKFDVTEKVASEESIEKLPRKDHVVLALRKLAENFEIERLGAGRRWEEKLAELSLVFKRPKGYGPSLDSFEKNAYAELGPDAVPELRQLRVCLHLPDLDVSLDKVAELQARHVTESSRELQLFKEANENRKQYLKYSNGLKWIQANSTL